MSTFIDNTFVFDHNVRELLLQRKLLRSQIAEVALKASMCADAARILGNGAVEAGVVTATMSRSIEAEIKHSVEMIENITASILSTESQIIEGEADLEQLKIAISPIL